ncbi:MAG: hypothetical protein FWG38_02715 [Defluviitaleaceae bacterium]|nr:hypothetical protein [Defluviitaleaceae bacterium]
MAYLRYFMPLVPETKGYEFKGRTPSGRCVIEERYGTGKLFVWVQDLKPEATYSVYLIFADIAAPDGYVGLSMGTLPVEPGGKAEFRQEIPQAQHPFKPEALTAVAVVANDTPATESPLCGYRHKQAPWRQRFKVWEAKTPHAPPQAGDVADPCPMEKTPDIEPDEWCPETDTPPVVAQAIPMEDVEEIEDAEEVEEVEETPISAPIPMAPNTRPTAKTHEPPTPPRATKPKTAGISVPGATPPQPQPAHASAPQRIEAVFNAGVLCTPFGQTPDSDTHWVTCREPGQIPLPPTRPYLMNEPFMQTAWADYEHFILGIATGPPAQYVIGVPCKNTAKNEVVATHLGFTRFEYSENSDADGYWLMFLDL